MLRRVGDVVVDRERFLVVLMMMMLFPKRQDAFLDRYFFV